MGLSNGDELSMTAMCVVGVGALLPAWTIWGKRTGAENNGGIKQDPPPLEEFMCT